jgi:hypothetical protein
MTVKELERAIKNCRGDAACIRNVESLFVTGGGTIAEQPGGKVFTDRLGGKVFIPSA